MPPPSSLQAPPAPRLEITDRIRAELARLTFQQTLPEQIGKPAFRTASTWGWSDPPRPVQWPGGSNAMWRIGVTRLFQSDPAALQSASVTLYPQPQYPTLHSRVFPTWWMVTPPQRLPALTWPVTTPAVGAPPKPKSFAEWLEDAVRKDWSKLQSHLDMIEKGQFIDPALEAVLKAVPEGAARDAVRKSAVGIARFIAGMVKDNASDAVIEMIEERYLSGLADMYFENHPTDGATQNAVRKLLDALVNRVLEGQTWSAPVTHPATRVPEFRGPLFPPDPGTSWSPGAQGSISPFGKFVIQGQFDPDFAIRKVTPKPFIGPF